MRILPTFKGYTIDYRLKEFRRVVSGKVPVFIAFESDEGRKLLEEVGRDTGLVITYASQQPDVWVCVCGNRAVEDGFFPCNELAERLEETLPGWLYPLYICGRCERVIDGDTFAVVSLPVETEVPAAV